MKNKFNIETEEYYISNDYDMNHKSYIYGEIDSQSFIDIIIDYNIYNKSFLDIGSGCGRLILSLIPISNKYNMLLSGIEIIKYRYDKSLNLLNEIIQKNNDNILNEIEFINSSFDNIYLGNYDIIYCCNMVFEKIDNNKLFDKIINEFQGYLFLFQYNDILKPYFYKEYKVNTSWSKDVALYMFIIF